MIILAITAKTMVRAEPTASTQPLITTVSLTGVKHPTTRAAKVSFLPIFRAWCLTFAVSLLLFFLLVQSYSFFYFLSSSTLMSRSFSSSNFSRASIFCLANCSSWLSRLAELDDSVVTVLMAVPCIATALLLTELT